jgi:hypothetical protein
LKFGHFAAAHTSQLPSWICILITVAFHHLPFHLFFSSQSKVSKIQP